MKTSLCIMTLLIPLIMLVIGLIFSRWTPKSINYLVGYRTRRSTLNLDTWRFANRTMGRVLTRWGLLLLIPSLLVLFYLKDRPDQAQDTGILILNLIQLAALILSIFPVERALKVGFDDKGRPRDPD